MADTTLPSIAPDERVRAVIDAVRPAVDDGRYAVKRVVGDQVEVEAHCFTDGHDVLRVILETMYRALGVSRTRAFFLLKDAALPKARFRFGMGQSAADMRTWMEVPLRGTQDLFVLALNQARDLVIKDLRSPELDPLIPEWYRPTTHERRYAVLLPLVVNQKSVGLFYVDGDEAGAALLTPTVLNNLKVLRSQAVLAIHQSTLRSAARKR